MLKSDDIIQKVTLKTPARSYVKKFDLKNRIKTGLQNQITELQAKFCLIMRLDWI